MGRTEKLRTEKLEELKVQWSKAREASIKKLDRIDMEAGRALAIKGRGNISLSAEQAGTQIWQHRLSRYGSIASPAPDTAPPLSYTAPPLPIWQRLSRYGNQRPSRHGNACIDMATPVPIWHRLPDMAMLLPIWQPTLTCMAGFGRRR